MVRYSVDGIAVMMMDSTEAIMVFLSNEQRSRVSSYLSCLYPNCRDIMKNTSSDPMTETI